MTDKPENGMMQVHGCQIGAMGRCGALLAIVMLRAMVRKKAPHGALSGLSGMV